MATRKPDNQKLEKSSTPSGVRYSPEMGDRLIETIREVCSIKQASKVLGMPDKTIYYWLNKYPDLKARLQIAQRQFYLEQDQENIFQAKENLKKYLFKGAVTVKKTFDSQGNVEKVEVTQAPTPQWVIDRILGTNDETQALRALATAQWIPDELAMDILGIIEDAQTDVKSKFQKSLTPPE